MYSPGNIARKKHFEVKTVHSHGAFRQTGVTWSQLWGVCLRSYIHAPSVYQLLTEGKGEEMKPLSVTSELIGFRMYSCICD